MVTSMTAKTSAADPPSVSPGALAEQRHQLHDPAVPPAATLPAESASTQTREW